ncbi:hypothetical protein OKW34_000613 [Paraburkholderia youngii]
MCEIPKMSYSVFLTVPTGTRLPSVFRAVRVCRVELPGGFDDDRRSGIRPAPQYRRRATALNFESHDVRRRQGRHHRSPARLAACGRAGRARPARRALDEDHAPAIRAGRETGLLPVDGVSDRQDLYQRAARARHSRSDEGGAREPRRRHGRADRYRTRRRARQRRPRPARRVLSRLDGDARHSGLRLRHPLPVRHVPSGNRQRRAGRGARLLAARR